MSSSRLAALSALEARGGTLYSSWASAPAVCGRAGAEKLTADYARRRPMPRSGDPGSIPGSSTPLRSTAPPRQARRPLSPGPRLRRSHPGSIPAAPLRCAPWRRPARPDARSHPGRGCAALTRVRFPAAPLRCAPWRRPARPDARSHPGRGCADLTRGSIPAAPLDSGARTSAGTRCSCVARSWLHGEGIPVATIGLLNPLLLVGRERTSFFGIVRQ